MTAAVLGGSIRHGAVWSAVNTIAMKFATIAVTAVVVRIVTPREFGTFAVAATIYAVVSSFAELGLSSCMSRRDFDPDRVGPTVVAVALMSSTILAAGMWVTARPLASALGATEAAGAVRILSTSVFLTGAFTAPTALLVREFRQRLLFYSTAIAFVPANGSLILLALHGDGATAFAWSRLIGQLCAGLYLTWKVKQRYLPRIDSVWVGRVLRFGLPLAGANLVNLSLLNADYVFVGHRLGPGLLGIYMLAFNVASWSTSVLSATINSVAMPAFSQANSDPSALNAMLSRSTRIVSLIGFPISTLTMALAQPLVTTLYGRKWTAAGPVLEVLAAYGALFVVSLVFANLLVGTGRAGRLLAIQSLWLLLLVPAMWAGLAYGGLRGVAVSHIVVLAFVILPVYMLLLARVLPGAGRVAGRAIAPPLTVAAVAGVVAWLVAQRFDHPVTGLLAGGASGGAIYAICSLGMFRPYLPVRLPAPAPQLYAFHDFVARRTGWSIQAGRRHQTGDATQSREVVLFPRSGPDERCHD